MTSSKRTLGMSVAAGIFALALPLAAALAAGSGSSTSTGSSSADSAMEAAKTAIAQYNYGEAQNYLQKVLAATPDDADALNLMGFTERKLGNPSGSLEYYNKALAQNPNHLGANEYLGELYLEMKDLEKAEERLAVLQQACGGSCEEYKELKEKIDQFKSTNG